ncbi:putative calcium-binding protein CML13 isoform B [Glycine soja]|uniref:Putative calcium-binding protein CML13 isoform B n=1 Tax=Glycine soja TaxID=3848 RepID=A0A445FRZ5_GLYSO|nr:putative calcium-binding protein CML13 isoform B [Glycine soja]
METLSATNLQVIFLFSTHLTAAIVAEENLMTLFDFPRFLDVMAKDMKPEPFDRQLRDAFKVLNKDSTGFVTVFELRHILTNIGEKLEPSEFDKWIREAPINDTDSKSQWEPLAPTKEAHEFHLSQTYHEGLLKLQAKEYEKARELLESVLKYPLIANAQVDSSASDGHLLQLRF